jgi:hypothetical protein
MIAGLLLALLLPWLLGAAWVAVLQRRWSGPVAWPVTLVLGYGYPLGVLATVTLMRLWDGWFGGLSFWPLALCLGILTGLGLALARPASAVTAPPAPAGRPAALWTLLTGLLGLLILARLALLGAEIGWRPLFPWDAWASWGQKAATWAELARLVPFGAAEEWRQRGAAAPGLFTVLAHEYPPLVPLLQAWTALGWGHWQDSLANLPWLLCLLALALGLHGQARLAGATPVVAWLWVYLLVSLPLLDAHVALAGYPDVWVAAFTGLMVMALLQWVGNRDWRLLLLALLLAPGVAQIKAEGVVWALLLLPALWYGLVRRPWALLPLAGLVAAAVVALQAAVPFALDLPGLGRVAMSAHSLTIAGLGSVRLEYHAVAGMFARGLFLQGNWHLFWYLFAGVLVLGLGRLRGHPALVAGYLFVVAAAGFLGVLFFFTSSGHWAEQGTVINRLVLQGTPAALFVALLAVHRPGAAGTRESPGAG